MRESPVIPQLLLVDDDSDLLLSLRLQLEADGFRVLTADSGRRALAIVGEVLPHLAVVGQSFSEHWFFSVLPDRWTTDHYASLWSHELTASSIRNSLQYSSLSALVDLVLGVSSASAGDSRRNEGETQGLEVHRGAL